MTCFVVIVKRFPELRGSFLITFLHQKRRKFFMASALWIFSFFGSFSFFLIHGKKKKMNMKETNHCESP